MISDLISCRERALEERNSQDKRRQGYMEIMRLVWEEKGYASLGLTAQNLRDKAAQVIKSREDNQQYDEETSGSNNNSDELVNENRQQDQYENINTRENVCINEEVINANQETSAEYINMHSHFNWGDLSGELFVYRVNVAYEEIVKWRRNIFLLPSGKAGKALISELARLYQSYADNSPLQGIALKACSVMQSLLLQKPHAKSKTKEHVACLERRMALWMEGNIDKLILEGKCIQKYLITSGKAEIELEKISRGFNRLMLQGKTRQAVRLISSANKGGLLNIDSPIPVGENENGDIEWKTTREVLLEKHPHARPPVAETLLTATDIDELCHDPIIFERITGEAIRIAANNTQGAAGPSGVDAYAWRRFCSSFESASVDLYNALAGVARRLCTSPVTKSGEK